MDQERKSYLAMQGYRFKGDAYGKVEWSNGRIDPYGYTSIAYLDERHCQHFGAITTADAERWLDACFAQLQQTADQLAA